jgi:hypothetical protein
MRPSLVAFLLSLTGCSPTLPLSCTLTDYDCNLRAYQQQIDLRPPRFEKASRLARDEWLSRNVGHVVRESDDYEASSYLRVLAAYPMRTRRTLCADQHIKAALQQRGALIRSPESEEYARILQEVGC